MKTLSYNPRWLELVDGAEVRGAPGGAEDNEAGAWAAQGNPGRQKCPAFPSDAVTQALKERNAVFRPSPPPPFSNNEKKIFNHRKEGRESSFLQQKAS